MAELEALAAPPAGVSAAAHHNERFDFRRHYPKAILVDTDMDPEFMVYHSGSMSLPADMRKEESALKERVASLFRLRQAVQQDAREVLRGELGGDVGDGRLHRDLNRVLRRLLRAAGLPPGAAQVFIGNSAIPQAFTTVTKSEAAAFQSEASKAQTFRVANVFLSVGLLRALKSEEELAFVLGHELGHVLLGHLKDFQATRAVLGHFHEWDADVFGLKLAAAAGYEPRIAMRWIYSYEEETKRLGSRYALLRRDKNDLLEALRQARAVHPDADLRSGNLLDHMDEALERYRPAPVPARPVWMLRRDAAERPTRRDRFETRVRRAVEDSASVEAGLRAIEPFFKRWLSLGKTGADTEEYAVADTEEYAVLEEAYRGLARGARSLEELKLLEVSIQRNKNGPFPTRKLRAELITRQLELVLAGWPEGATLEDFLKVSGALSSEARRAGTLRLLGRIQSRRQLDAAFRALSRSAEDLSLIVESDVAARTRAVSDLFIRRVDDGRGDIFGLQPEARRGKDLREEVARRLWGAARRVLSGERGVPAAPEDIIAELKAGLLPSFLRDYYEGFRVEILDSAFGPTAFRSQKRRPSELVAQLEDWPQKAVRNKILWQGAVSGLSAWGQRRHAPTQATLEGNGKVSLNYARFRLDGLSASSQADLQDLFRHFVDPARIPAPLIELLKREGRLESSLESLLEKLGDELRKNPPHRSWSIGWEPPPRMAGAIDRYAAWTRGLLAAGLRDVRDFESALKLAEAAWRPVEKLLAAEGAGARSAWAPLGAIFFESLRDAFAGVVQRRDRAGLGAQPAELQRAARLVARIETVLGLPSGAARVRGHASRLAAALHDEKKYLDAYAAAFPTVFWASSFWEPRPKSRRGRFWDWIMGQLEKTGLPDIATGSAQLAYFLLVLPVGLAWFFLAPVIRTLISRGSDFLWRRRIQRTQLALQQEPRSERLTAQDLIHLLALAGDDGVGGRTKFLAAALLDYPAGRSDIVTASEGLQPPGAAVAGRWLMQSAVEQARAEELPALAQAMLRLKAMHPAFLSAASGIYGSPENAFRNGAQYALRSEPYRSLADGSHPFRGVNVRWAESMLERLDEHGAWPQSTEDRLDLLDLLNSTGEFSEAIDRRIVETAEADVEGFLRWVKRDEERLRSFKQIVEENHTLKTPWGQFPLPIARPLRIVRNPALRVRLFDLLPGNKSLSERPRTSWRQALAAKLRLWKAYRSALRFYSKEFLKSLKRHGGSIQEKMLEVYEETDRVVAQRLAEDDPAPPADGASTEERAAGKEQEKARLEREALSSLHALYQAHASDQDPLLGDILADFPEPTRWRDGLLERLIKARRLSPDALGFLEGHKNYRMPNPLRVMEKQAMDLAVAQMRKLTPEERVEILLDLAGVKPLEAEREKELDRRLLQGRRRKLARDELSIHRLSQMKRYLSLLHPKDRALLIRAQFYGETSLHRSPAAVEGFFEALIERPDLPPFLKRTFRAYFAILDEDEKARLFSDLAAIVGERELSGPELLRAFLSGKVTGAKVAQVLASHKGLLPREYWPVLEYSKDQAQADKTKHQAFELIQHRLEALSKELQSPRLAGREDRIGEIGREALPKVKEAGRRRLAQQVRYLLGDGSRQARPIEFIGRELGSGSIKLVYKIELGDGRVWVAKLRAPGASYGIRREFDIWEQLIARLEAEGTLDADGALQAAQLFQEVRGLVQAEMDFRQEAAKEAATAARLRSRPWYARLLAGRAPRVPAVHPVYQGEDLLLEEFVTSTRFADLPRSRWFGPSQQKIARQSVREGMFSLVFDEWLEPDPHTGNRLARRGWLHRFFAKAVFIDLGQGKPLPLARLKPLMRAAVALESDDPRSAARELAAVVGVPAGREAEVEAALLRGMAPQQSAGTTDRLVAGILEAETIGALPKPEYASLQKAFLLYGSYSEYIPADFLDQALQRAAAARALKDRVVSLPRLAWIGLRKALFGTAAVRAELEGVIERLGSSPAPSGSSPA